VAKRRLLSDPFAEREKMRYSNPIPSRELIMEILKKNGKPASAKELQKQLCIKKDPERIEAFNRRLNAMERDGQLHTTRRGEYGLVKKMNLIPGRVIGHRDGYGFVVPDDGSDDLFLPAKYMRAVFDGDRVLVRIANVDKRGRLEASIVQVLECNTTQLVGKFIKEHGLMFVSPDHKRITQEILVAPGDENGAKSGQIVTVQITSQPTVYKQANGKIIEVLGNQRAPGMEIDIAVRTHSLPHAFSDIVIKESKKFKELKPGLKYPDRKDIRDLPLVTIDGEDAMDFDDAVYTEKLKNGWRLVVAIADVSHYVQPHSELDQEAYLRGNSVYFPGKVIPMLPEHLSNGLCSLNPNVDRFCMVCDMEITADGEIKKYQLYPGVMNSKARLTYTLVAGALDGQKKAREIIGNLYPHIETFHELYQQLLKKRRLRGALDFDTVETKVIFSDDRKIDKIVPVTRNVAHKMIEEAMLCANVCASKHLLKQKIPALYRTHEGPNPEKLQDLRDFLKEFNLGLRGGDDPSPRDYSDLLESIQNRPEAGIIQTVLLRSLQQAVYSPENEGHFGLAYEAYTHFTSPIRRYPDLLIHRQIKSPNRDIVKLEQIGEHCSFTERRADEATRDAMTALKCEFIASRVGETFAGIVTTVTGFGLFVELQDLYVEGLVHISLLPADYYRFEQKRHRLMGERTGLNFTLGDKVKVKIVRVDIDDKKIDLELVVPAKKNGVKNGKPKKR